MRLTKLGGIVSRAVPSFAAPYRPHCDLATAIGFHEVFVSLSRAIFRESVEFTNPVSIASYFRLDILFLLLIGTFSWIEPGLSSPGSVSFFFSYVPNEFVPE